MAATFIGKLPNGEEQWQLGDGRTITVPAGLVPFVSPNRPTPTGEPVNEPVTPSEAVPVEPAQILGGQTSYVDPQTGLPPLNPAKPVGPTGPVMEGPPIPVEGPPAPTNQVTPVVGPKNGPATPVQPSGPELSRVTGAQDPSMNPSMERGQVQPVQPNVTPVAGPKNGPRTNTFAPSGKTYQERQDQITEERKRINNEKAKLVGRQSDEQYTAMNKALDDYQQALYDYEARRKEISAKADQETQGFMEEWKQVGNTEIDRDRFWKSQSTAQKVLNIAGIVIGGGIGLLYKTENSALSQVNKAIDDDIKIQQANLNNKKESLKERQSLFQDNLKRWGDETSATLATQYQLLGVAQQKVSNLALKYGGENAALAAQEFNAQLEEAKNDKLEALKLQREQMIARKTGRGGSGSKKSDADPEVVVNNLQVPETDKNGNIIYQNQQVMENGVAVTAKPVISSRTGKPLVDEAGRPTFQEGEYFENPNDPNIPVGKRVVVPVLDAKGKPTGQYRVIEKKPKTKPYEADTKQNADKLRDINSYYAVGMRAFSDMRSIYSKYKNSPAPADKQMFRNKVGAVITAFGKIRGFRQQTKEEMGINQPGTDIGIFENLTNEVFGGAGEAAISAAQEQFQFEYEQVIQGYPGTDGYRPSYDPPGQGEPALEAFSGPGWEKKDESHWRVEEARKKQEEILNKQREERLKREQEQKNAPKPPKKYL